MMGVELCMKHRDHIVIIMRYFPHHKFPVTHLAWLTVTQSKLTVMAGVIVDDNNKDHILSSILEDVC